MKGYAWHSFLSDTGGEKIQKGADWRPCYSEGSFVGGRPAMSESGCIECLRHKTSALYEHGVKRVAMASE